MLRSWLFEKFWLCPNFRREIKARYIVIVPQLFL